MTHSSYHHYSSSGQSISFDCYQRLEFLGDAVLDFLITYEVFSTPGNNSPGILTDIRSALVNNHKFGEMCVENGLHEFFFHSIPDVFKKNDDFFSKLTKEIDEETGQETGKFKWPQMASGEAPKQIGDIFESLAGAVFIDNCNPIVSNGYALTMVWSVFKPLIQDRMIEYCTNPPVSPIRELLERFPQTKFSDSPEKLSDTTVRICTEVNIQEQTFKYWGVGLNYKTAKELAAKEALKDLKSKGFMAVGRRNSQGFI